VLARSEVDAAGQIVAKAGNDITVEDDARLSVSGNAGADAGAIRLHAGRRLKLAASIDVAADGGSETVHTVGGRGGLIELKAPEIDVRVVNESLGDTLHAEAGDLAGFYSRAGRIVFDESTDYTFAVHDGPSLSTIRNGSTTTDSGSNITTEVRTLNENNFDRIMPGHDGSYLAVNKNIVESYTFTGPTNAPGIIGVGYTTEEYQLLLISPDGQSTNLGVLRTNPNPRNGRIMTLEGTGLAKGGWFVQAGDKGYFISRAGAVLSTMDIPTGDMFLGALSSGGVLLQTPTEEVVYSAIGQRLETSMAEAVLADQHRNRPYSSRNSHIGDGINLNGVRDYSIDSNPLPNYRIEYGQSTTPFLFGDVYHYRELGGGGYSMRDTRHVRQYARGEFNAVVYYRERTERSLDQKDMKLVKRVFSHVTVDVPELSGAVLTPPLLASQPGARNGVASTGGLTPPSAAGPTLPVLGPTTPAPAQPGAGVNPAAPTASLPPPRQGPVPRLELFNTPKPEAPPAGVSAKAVVAEPRTPEQEKEILDGAEKNARELLGEAAAERLKNAKTPEARAQVTQEMVYAINVGPEMYDVTRDLNNDMRGALFTSLSDIQKLALADDPALADGLKNALSKQREGNNPDGSPRGTAMQEPLLKLQRELAYAFTPAERERVQRRMTRELIHSAKEQAGETVDRKADLVIEEPDGTKVRFTEAGDLVRS
jgi:hypothetical protein